jgi:hypothetical protein
MICFEKTELPAETASHQVHRATVAVKLMPSAKVIQSANRRLGTAITTGISALNARSTRYERPLPSRSSNEDWRARELSG